jgi:hypothetical protein
MKKVNMHVYLIGTRRAEELKIQKYSFANTAFEISVFGHAFIPVCVTFLRGYFNKYCTNLLYILLNKLFKILSIRLFYSVELTHYIGLFVDLTQINTCLLSV